MDFHETATTLTLSSPLWKGILALGVGYALAGWFFYGAFKAKSRFKNVFIALFGFVIVSVVGYGLIVSGVTFDATGASRRDMNGTESIAWKDVAEIKIEPRKVRRADHPHLILKRKIHGEVAINLAGREPQEVERMVAFAQARAGK